jgi:hypothetical protein
MSMPTDRSMAVLQEEPVNPHLARGFGPLLVGAVLFLLMVLLAPTVASEHIVTRPVSDSPATTAPATATTTATTATTAPTGSTAPTASAPTTAAP